MAYTFKNFIYNYDITILSTYNEETGESSIASNSDHQLRNFGSIIFNAVESGIPLIEIVCKLRETMVDEIFDPLFSLVMGDVGSGYNIMLYYCHNDGTDYVQLASYEGLFAEDYNAVLSGLISYRDGGELSIETMNGLKSLLSKANTFLQNKISYIRAI